MAWNSIGPGGLLPLTDPVAITDEAVCVEVFAGQSGGVAYSVANSPLGGWTTWNGTSSPKPAPPGPSGCFLMTAAKQSDQRLALFVANFDPDAPGLTVWYMAQAKAGRSSDSNWTDPNWTPVYSESGDPFIGSPGTELGKPAVGTDVHGALHVFVPVFDPNVPTNFLAHSAETAPGSGTWTTWQNLGGDVPPAYRPAVVTNADGRLEVFVRNGSSVQHNWQTTPGGGWSGWGSLGSPNAGAAGDVAAAIAPGSAGNWAGCLIVFVVGSDSSLNFITQTKPNNGWSQWKDLGGPGAPLRLPGSSGQQFSTPVIGDNAGGTLQAYVVAQDNSIRMIGQQIPGGAFAGWTSLGVPGPTLATNPAVGVIPHNNLLQLFVIGEDGNVYHRSQIRTGTW
jgi:hypothetical protein